MDNGNFNIGKDNTPNWSSFNLSDSEATSANNQTQTTGFNFQTSISTSEGGLSSETKLYLNPAFKPSLVPSTADKLGVAETNLDHLFNFDTILQTIVQMNGTPPPGSPGDEFAKELAKIPVDDPEILALAQKKGIVPGQLFHSIQVYAQILFDQTLENLPKSEADKLRFAHNNPDAAKTLTPAEKARLQKLEGQVTKKIQEQYGFSAQWKGIPADNSYFNQRITNQYDDQVETAIESLKDSGKLTEKQALQIRSLHYQTSDKATADPNLLQILENLETSAAASLRAQYGADADWRPQADVTYYAAVLNGRFQAAFETTLNNLKPPLNADTKSQIIKSFSNPDDPSIPDNIKQLTKTIQAAATKIVVEEFGLPPTWAPTTTNAVSLHPNASLANSAINTLQEAYSSIGQFVEALPHSPEKIAYGDFLKAIGLAIIKLQELLYATQSADSYLSKNLSNAKLDQAMNQISIQQQKADETKEKLQKMAGLGPLKAMFEWIIKIIMLIIAFMLGPIMFALVLTYIIDSTKAQLTNTPSLCEQMFTAISDEAGEGPAIAINMILTFGISMGNPLLFIQMFTNDSRCIQNFVSVCGGDKAAQEMTAAIFAMVMQMAIMFPLVILSGGAATPIAVADSLAKATGWSLDATTRITKAASIAYACIMASLEVSNNAVHINNSVLKAQIELIKADSESYSEEARALIQILKQLIQKLLDLMNERADFILDLSNFQSKKYSDVSKIISELYS